MRSQNGQVPGWLKVVLVLLAVGVVGFIVLIVVAFKTVQTAMNPEHGAQVAHEIMNVQEPLPSGWKYFLTVPIPGAKAVSFMDGNNNMVQIFQYPNPEHKTPEQFMSDPKLTKSQLFLGGPSDKGTETVGGQSMYYVRGKTQPSKSSSATGGQIPLEMGCIVVPGSGKMILIQSFEPTKTAFDPAVVKPLFDDIKAFNI